MFERNYSQRFCGFRKPISFLQMVRTLQSHTVSSLKVSLETLLTMDINRFHFLRWWFCMILGYKCPNTIVSNDTKKSIILINCNIEVQSHSQ